MEKQLHTVSVANSDKAMNAAIRKARATVRDFLKVLKTPKKGQDTFAVKKRFDVGDNHEHIWLNNLKYDGHLIYGDVANIPEEIKKVKFGDHVTVSPNAISDWAYGDNGKLVGGFTIRVLYNRSSAADKKQIAKGMGLKF